MANPSRRLTALKYPTIVTERVCAACNRAIDPSAKSCPFCGANPLTGERLDTQAILQEVFSGRELSPTENVIEYARQRQGLFIALSLLGGFLILAALHQFVTMRNATEVSEAPAITLSEIADVTRRVDEAAPQPLPDLQFQHSGDPRRMRVWIVERGAVTPPEIAAAQQPPRPAGAVRPRQAPGAQPQGVQQPGTVARPQRPNTSAVPRPATRPQQ